jgi:alkanesulfonate monooxygenase SsuD/methylene tetrahydromethanopterin reductase-like flavin-dependent oxidoreductase (luciferase family)
MLSFLSVFSEGSIMPATTFWYHLPVKEGVSHTLKSAEKAEEVGFDVVSQMDHFLYESPQRGCIPECWTMLCAVASRTGLTVSPLVMCSLFRNPALTAKMVATLDQLTQGRVYMAIGAGWWEREFDAYGYQWLPPKDRVDRTIEATRIMRRLWTEPKVDYEGDFWRIEGCQLVPRPYTDPHPLLWNGGSGPRMLRMAGELCDGWVTGSGDADYVSEKMEEVLEHSQGGEKVFGHYLSIGEGQLDFDGARERIEEFSDLGVSHFMVILSPDSESLEMLDGCEDLISSFR